MHEEISEKERNREDLEMVLLLFTSLFTSASQQSAQVQVNSWALLK